MISQCTLLLLLVQTWQQKNDLIAFWGFHIRSLILCLQRQTILMKNTSPIHLFTRNGIKKSYLSQLTQPLNINIVPSLSLVVFVRCNKYNIQFFTIWYTKYVHLQPVLPMLSFIFCKQTIALMSKAMILMVKLLFHLKNTKLLMNIFLQTNCSLIMF